MLSTQADLKLLYDSVAGWWDRSAQKRAERRAIRMHEKQKQEALEKAKSRLLSQMVPEGVHMSPSEIKAKQEITDLAARMAETSPIGLSIRQNDLLGSEEPTLQNRQFNTSFTGEGEEDLTSTAADDLVQEHFGKANTLASRTTQKRTGLVKTAQKKRDNTKKTRINVTKEEQIFADNLDTADAFIPRPRRAEIKQIDTSISGWWESNPNCDDLIQDAARLPIVHNQIREIIQHLITSRPTIQGPPELVSHIRKWFEIESEITTGYERGLDRFISDLAKQILYYGSAALIKQRSGDPKFKITDQIADIDRGAVWNYAIPDMSTLEVFIDDKGRPRKWRQSPDLFPETRDKTYSARDVFVARLPIQNSSLYFWTPAFVMPVIYPVQVLKDLHNNIDAHSRSIVDILYYAQVGSKDYKNGAVTKKMIDTTITTINNTSRRATPVFPYYVTLNKLELDDYTKQLVDTAKFWEQEIRRGIGGSMLQDGVGDSATRNTSDALMEKEMRAAQALIPEIQRAFRWLILDKLYEIPGFKIDQVKTWDEMPSLVFEEIDMYAQIRRETQATLVWQSDGYTHDEFRAALGKDEDTTRKGKYFSDIQQANAEKMEAQKAAVKSQAAPGGTPRPKRAKE